MHSKLPPLTLNSIVLTEVDHVKYGVHFTNNRLNGDDITRHSYHIVCHCTLLVYGRTTKEVW